MHLLGRHQLTAQPDELEMVLLLECGSSIEVTAIRSVLESQDINCLVQGEHQTHFVGLSLSATVQPRVMVTRRDLERARAILASQAVYETTGDPLEGGLCAVHEEQAIAVCGRCGSFLCARCQSLGSPPICESCTEAEKMTPRSSAQEGQAKVFFVILAIVIALMVTRAWWWA